MTIRSLMPPGRLRRRVIGVAAALGMAPLTAAVATAIEIDLGPELDLSWSTTLGYGFGYRLEDQSQRLLADINADDGNRSFDEGVMRNRVSGVSELSLAYRNFGAFVRGNAFYDRVYHRDNDNDSAATDNTPSNPEDEFVDHTEDVNGGDTHLLDAYVYADFQPAGTRLNLRAGRQVVSWGESLFIPGLSSAQGPVDVTQSHFPGVEVKNILLPVGQFLGRWRLTRNLSVAGYYQWQWEPNRLDGTGGYFSQTDILAGGEVILADTGTGIVPALTRTGDDRASDSGQYGFNLHYTVPGWSYTDFGLYYLRYHDKSPSVVLGGFGVIPGMPGTPTTYHARYFEDIDLYGASFSTAFGAVSLGGELTYRDGIPVLDENEVPVRAEVAQVQVNTIVNLPVNLLGSQLTTVTAEVGANSVRDREDDELANDKRALGYQALLTLQYPNVLPSVDLSVPLSVQHGVDGDSSVAGTFNSGNLRLQAGADFVYRAVWEIGFSYVNYRGDPDDNPLTDRDFVSADVKYSF